MSTSAALEICAGSKSDTSCAIGKLSVWSVANGWGIGAVLVGLPIVSTSNSAISPMAIPALAGR